MKKQVILQKDMKQLLGIAILCLLIGHIGRIECEELGTRRRARRGVGLEKLDKLDGPNRLNRSNRLDKLSAKPSKAKNSNSSQKSIAAIFTLGLALLGFALIIVGVFIIMLCKCAWIFNLEGLEQDMYEEV